MTVGKVEGYQGHLSRSKGRRDCEFEFENEPCYFILYRWLRFLQKLKLIDQFKTFTFWNCSRIFFQYLENGTKYSEKSLLKTPSNISQTRADNKAVLVVFKLSITKHEAKTRVSKWKFTGDQSQVRVREINGIFLLKNVTVLGSLSFITISKKSADQLTSVFW